jgi:hypothetical protein
MFVDNPLAPFFKGDKLSTFGQWMSGKLLLVSLEVTAYALIIWIILRVIRFRSAKVREAFWLTVLFKMVFSLFIALPISFSISSQSRMPSGSEQILNLPLVPLNRLFDNLKSEAHRQLHRHEHIDHHRLFFRLMRRHCGVRLTGNKELPYCGYQDVG